MVAQMCIDTRSNVKLAQARMDLFLNEKIFTMSVSGCMLIHRRISIVNGNAVYNLIISQKNDTNKNVHHIIQENFISRTWAFSWICYAEYTMPDGSNFIQSKSTHFIDHSM